MHIYDFIIPILLAMILVFLIGHERQLTGHMAGIRINVLLYDNDTHECDILVHEAFR
ncbi:MgtC/SapB family protein [Holdemanella biformis]|uniref:MgtC/SapB family protein n=1 Tax=Holdemanella porci TaxID=2652276 RepID=A0A6N7V3U6_9FIRM|nr:MgtC/SapB family protein [Holdemanella porci]